MGRDDNTSPPSVDADGPMVAVCAGHRCDALHRLAAAQNGVERLRESVAGCRGAVLISAPCLGHCSHGALAVVARRDGATRSTGPPVWLGGIDREDLMEPLRAWIRSGGPANATEPGNDVDEVLPTALSTAVIRVGPGVGP